MVPASYLQHSVPGMISQECSLRYFLGESKTCLATGSMQYYAHNFVRVYQIDDQYIHIRLDWDNH